MALTSGNKTWIKNAIAEEIVEPAFVLLDDRLLLLEADIKDIRFMITDLQNNQKAQKAFSKVPLEEKILRAYADIVLMAKEAGVSLPKS